MLTLEVSMNASQPILTLLSSFATLVLENISQCRWRLSQTQVVLSTKQKTFHGLLILLELTHKLNLRLCLISVMICRCSFYYLLQLLLQS
jgi:hypothetical protein